MALLIPPTPVAFLQEGKALNLSAAFFNPLTQIRAGGPKASLALPVYTKSSGRAKSSLVLEPSYTTAFAGSSPVMGLTGTYTKDKRYGLDPRLRVGLDYSSKQGLGFGANIGADFSVRDRVRPGQSNFTVSPFAGVSAHQDHRLTRALADFQEDPVNISPDAWENARTYMDGGPSFLHNANTPNINGYSAPGMSYRTADSNKSGFYLNPVVGADFKFEKVLKKLPLSIQATLGFSSNLGFTPTQGSYFGLNSRGLYDYVPRLHSSAALKYSFGKK
jgi:hypothetical protein